MRFLLPFVMLLLSAGGPGVHAGARDDLAQRLTGLTKAAMAASDASGVALVIELGGERLFEGAYGRMHFGGNQVMSVQGTVPAACLMDLFTSLLVLRQIDEGKLDDQEPLASYVKGLEWKGECVSMHHLLTHTSGVAPMDGFAAQLRVVEVLFQRGDLWKQVAAQPLLSTPGACQTFRGTNTYLAGKVLEELTGQTLQELIVQQLIEPLELTGTGYDQDAAAQLDQAAYQIICAPGLEEDPSGTARFGAASLVTTASDLARIVRGLADQELVSRRVWAHLAGTHRLNDGQVLRYAHGLSSTAVDSFDGFTFGGANGHERIHVTYYPNLDLTIAITADCGVGVLPQLTERLVREVFDLPLTRISDRSMPEGTAQFYVGTYLLGCNQFDVRITEDEHLLLVSEDRPDLRLLYQGGHHFVADTDRGLRLIFQVEDQSARSFVLSAHGTDALAVRLHRDG